MNDPKLRGSLSFPPHQVGAFPFQPFIRSYFKEEECRSALPVSELVSFVASKRFKWAPKQENLQLLDQCCFLNSPFIAGIPTRPDVDRLTLAPAEFLERTDQEFDRDTPPLASSPQRRGGSGVLYIVLRALRRGEDVLLVASSHKDIALRTGPSRRSELYQAPRL